MGLGHTAQACAKASMADFSQSWIATTRLRPTFSARTRHVWVHVAEPDRPLPFLGQLHELEEGSKSHTTEIERPVQVQQERFLLFLFDRLGQLSTDASACSGPCTFVHMTSMSRTFSTMRRRRSLSSSRDIAGSFVLQSHGLDPGLNDTTTISTLSVVLKPPRPGDSCRPA